MNKIYSVLRVDSWNNTQEVYTGRIRDCKKSLKILAEAASKDVMKQIDKILINL